MAGVDCWKVVPSRSLTSVGGDLLLYALLAGIVERRLRDVVAGTRAGRTAVESCWRVSLSDTLSAGGERLVLAPIDTVERGGLCWPWCDSIPRHEGADSARVSFT